jgi:hypothetical protein
MGGKTHKANYARCRLSSKDSKDQAQSQKAETRRKRDNACT